jgi:hypothetical protein
VLLVGVSLSSQILAMKEEPTLSLGTLIVSLAPGFC